MTDVKAFPKKWLQWLQTSWNLGVMCLWIYVLILNAVLRLEWRVSVVIVLVILGLVVLLRRRRPNQLLTVTESGGIYRDRVGQTAFVDAQISDISWQSQQRVLIDDRVVQVTRLMLTLELPQGSNRLRYQYQHSVNESDPLMDFRYRNLKRLIAKAELALTQQGRITGKGWSLTETEMIVETEIGEKLHPLNDLKLVYHIGDRIHLWWGDDERSSVQIPVDSPQSAILLNLLQSRIPPDQEKEFDREELGPVLFVRNRSIQPWGYLILGLIAGPLLAISLMFLFLGLLDTNMIVLMAALILSGMFSMPAGALIAYYWFHRIDVLRCHWLGFSYTTTRHGCRTLRYDQIDEYTFAILSDWLQMIPGRKQLINPRFLMLFEAHSDDQERIEYQGFCRMDDPELTLFEELVLQAMVKRMKAQLARGNNVPWTHQLLFTPEGLEIGCPTIDNPRIKSLFIPNADLQAAVIQDRVFYLYVRGHSQPIYHCSSYYRNFPAGWVLLSSLLTSTEEANTPEATSKTDSTMPPSTME